MARTLDQAVFVACLWYITTHNERPLRRNSLISNVIFLKMNMTLWLFLTHLMKSPSIICWSISGSKWIDPTQSLFVYSSGWTTCTVTRLNFLVFLFFRIYFDKKNFSNTINQQQNIPLLVRLFILNKKTPIGHQWCELGKIRKLNSHT